VGDPAASEVALGPIIDAGQRDRIHSIVTESAQAGARVVAGGTYEELFYRPTVIADGTRDHAAGGQEIFGPGAPVLTFRTLEEAAEIVNDSEYGLSVGILGDVGQAMLLADMVQSGKVHINEQTVMDEANAPFGGTKSSGNGSRIGGVTANIDAFT